MPSIADMFSNKEVLTYFMNRTYQPLFLEQLFPEIKRDSLEFEVIKGANRTPVIANVHAFDTEAEIHSREASVQALELAYVKRKSKITEKDLMALRKPRDAAEQSYLMSRVYDDMDQMIMSLRARAERMRAEALTEGKVTLEGENGQSLGSVDYFVPAENKEVLAGTDLWTDASADPLEDIYKWSTQLNGGATRALTSTPVLQALLRHENVIKGIYGTNSGRRISVSELNEWLTMQGMPSIAVYDTQYRKQGKDGKYTKQRYFRQNAFVMFGDEPLGETIYGPTPEESKLLSDPSIQAGMVGNFSTMVYETNQDPIATWKKVSGTYLPSFPAADEVFQATVLG